jgi:hypothetical protein
MDKNYSSLRERTTALIINLILFYGAFLIVTGRLLPSGGLESVWLLSAIALWFLTLLSAPWFVPPRDALANAVGAAAILVTIDLTSVAYLKHELNLFRWASAVYCVFVTFAALLALLLHDRNERSPWSGFSFRLAATFGRGELLYTPSAFISIAGAYQGDFSITVFLLALWVLFVIARPAEQLLTARRYWLAERAVAAEFPSVGRIERVDHPNILRIRIQRRSSWKPGSLYVAAMPDGAQQYTLALFTQVQGTDVIGTGLCVAKVAEEISMSDGEVRLARDAEKVAEFIENLSGVREARLVGFTVENSTIGTVRFEIAASSGLQEGDVVFARVEGHEVFYQIVDAETAEESFDQNPRGTHIVRAAQLGCYNPARGFVKFAWLPLMNSPMFMAKERSFPPLSLSADEFTIGRVPTTNIAVAAGIEDLVEYHTAVLGVTGTGKTELALDVIREAVVRETKVFCVDFTGDYRRRLANLNPTFPSPTSQQAADLEAKLFAVETGEYGAKAEKKALKEEIDKLRSSTRVQIADFLGSANSSLAIFELAEITNTRATLRLTELYLSAIMAWAREHRRQRRILIVLEEAHTIVPETAGVGFDAETQWVVSRIGQIALQGRKYGVGLFVITQRTALVSKTILSQCNTFLTHCLIDQTSLNFLESVYGSQHARLIPNLRNLEFLAFGKGIRAERPILLKRDFDPAKKTASLKFGDGTADTDQVTLPPPSAPQSPASSRP